ncbi:MAG: hypothetical protein Q7S86_04640 [bacterium]|nr:hypothetical protein [bacterium]
MQPTRICPACTAGHHGDCPVNFIQEANGFTCECGNPKCVEERLQLEKRKSVARKPTSAKVEDGVLG